MKANLIVMNLMRHSFEMNRSGFSPIITNHHLSALAKLHLMRENTFQEEEQDFISKYGFKSFRLKPMKIQ